MTIHPTKATTNTGSAQRDRSTRSGGTLLRAAVPFTFLAIAGLVLAAVVAPRLGGFDKFVVLTVGGALFGAAVAFFLVVAFVLGE